MLLALRPFVGVWVDIVFIEPWVRHPPVSCSVVCTSQMSGCTTFGKRITFIYHINTYAINVLACTQEGIGTFIFIGRVVGAGAGAILFARCTISAHDPPVHTLAHEGAKPGLF